MGTKANPGQFDCYDGAAPDEEIFVLRANDPLYFRMVQQWRTWTLEMVADGILPDSYNIEAKLAEAGRSARAGRAWLNAKRARDKEILAKFVPFEGGHVDQSLTADRTPFARSDDPPEVRERLPMTEALRRPMRTDTERGPHGN